MTLRLRALIGSACVATLAAASLTLGAVSASAHSNLIDTNPGEGEIVAELPEEVVMTFSDGVQDGYTEVAVQYDGATMEVGDPVTDGDTVTQPLAPLPADQATVDATVSFRIVSADGHPVDGTFTFTIDTALSEAPEGSESGSGTSDEDAATTGDAAQEEESTDDATPVATSGDEDSDSSTGMLVAIMAAVLVVLLIAGFELRRRARRNNADNDQAQDSTT